MINLLRNGVVMIVSSPVIAAIHCLSLVIGKERAIALIGPAITRGAKRSLRYWVPPISSAADFDQFRSAMKRNISRWRLLYDIRITRDTTDIFSVHLSNCPFCRVFTLAGLSGLNAYFCDADWKVAAKNKDTWLFERKHTIGAGDAYCDHTYRRVGYSSGSFIGRG